MTLTKSSLLNVMINTEGLEDKSPKGECGSRLWSPQCEEYIQYKPKGRWKSVLCLTPVVQHSKTEFTAKPHLNQRDAGPVLKVKHCCSLD